MKKIVLAGASSSSGKTTISCGLMRLLYKKGYKVAPYKVGPDYIDPAFHEKACKHPSRNLDEFMLPKEEIKYIFGKSQKDADIHIIEGVMGLYDGYGNTIDYCSTASMSKILDAKVILILDAKSLAGSAAAMVLGYKELDKNINIAGVIVNRVSSESHYNIVKEAIEEHTGIPVVGRVPKNENFAMSSRHLGLTPSGEIEALDQQLDLVADTLEEYLDIEKLLAIAESRELSYDFNRRKGIRDIANVKIGIARDKAFNFYYEDSLRLLEEMGASFVEFSPMKDKALPKCDGVFLGGGFPEVFAKELAENQSIRQSIEEFGEAGGLIFGECGGLMYLGESLLDQDGIEQPMVGLLKGSSQMTKRLQRFGYCQGTANIDTPIASKGQVVKGHEFHYSDFESKEEKVFKMEKFKDGNLLKAWEGGFIYKNVLGTYLHSHFCGNYTVAENFLRSIERTAKK